MHALLVMEELSGKVTVEEFDTISNGFRESRARERGSEWLKVQLKHKVPIETAKIERSQLTIKTRDISHQISKINKIFTQKKKKLVYLPSTSSSLKCKYSETCNSSIIRAWTLTLMYSHTPGLGRRARATHGGKTMAS